MPCLPVGAGPDAPHSGGLSLPVIAMLLLAALALAIMLQVTH